MKYVLFNVLNVDVMLSLMKSHNIEIAKGHGNIKVSEDFDLDEDDNMQMGLLISDIIEKPEPDQILSNYYSLPFYFIQ